MKRLVVARVDPMDNWSGVRCDWPECQELGWWTFVVEERDVDVDEAPEEDALACHTHRDETFETLREKWL